MFHFRTILCQTLLPGLLMLIMTTAGFGQTAKLTGSVVDSNAVPLIGATVVLVQPLDSIMAAYSISGNSGNFVLNGVKSGDYYLQITYIGYGNFRQEIAVRENESEQSLGTILLSPKNTLLEQVTVKAEHVPIVIKNDTIEYNADAFLTKPNAVVEDLLRQLPGVQVERDGSIKAQGENVENVLVDGKEFFGKDPKIATQNLPADIVDKVQVYDKQSDMAEFSGIDDGQEEKTINLSLKDGKKKGYFGNITAGFGAADMNNIRGNERYQGKLNINRFDSKLQLSLLGMANNNNDNGFSFNDYINFMGGMNNFMSGGGMSFNMGAAGMPMGNMSNPGITSTAAGGLNFNYDFGKKVDWQSSYFANHIDNNITSDVNSQNLGGANSFQKLETSERNNKNLNHRLNTSLRIKFDSAFQATWTNRLSFNTGDLYNMANAQTFAMANQLENQSDILYGDDGEQFGWVSDLTVRKKLGKPGRVASVNYNINIGDAFTDANVYNETTIYSNGVPDFSQRIFQDQESDEEQLQHGLALTYIEPLSNKTFLGLNAKWSNYKNERQSDYYDIDPNNPSSRVRNIQLSNHFIRNYSYYQIGSYLRVNSKSVKFSSGLNFQQSELNGDIMSEDIQLTKRFEYLLPWVNIDYEITSSKNIQFTYRTRIQEPSLEQLQPSVNNTDPLYVYLGNPDLKPEYIHESNIHFMLFDQFSFTNIFANFNTQYSLNKIVNKTTVDDQYRQTVSPINTDNELNTRLYASFGTPLKFMRSKVSVDVNLSYNRGILFVNEEKNSTDRWTNNYTLVLENRKKDIVDVAFGASLGTNSVNYSESESFNQSYFDQTYFTDMAIYFPGNWTFESSFDFTKYSDESFGEQDDLAIWKASISKHFLKKERGTLELSVYDILNKNQGINRRNGVNYIQESRTNILGRYVMLSFNYKLSQFGGGGLQIEFDSGRRR